VGKHVGYEAGLHAQFRIAVRLESLTYVEAASCRLQCGFVRLGNRHGHTIRQRTSPVGKRAGYEVGLHARFRIAVRLESLTYTGSAPHAAIVVV